MSEGKDSSYIESTSAAISSQNLEQQQKYVIIWELYDVCAVLDQMNPNFLHFSTTMNIELYSHLLRNVFKIVNFDTFKYTNVLDFPVDSPSKNLPQSSSKSNVGQQAALDTSTPFNLDKPIEKLNEIFKIYERFRKVSSFGG
uniref:Uncharacterized protein n=1 Tax=Meloidogyne hapla TaxID=6305 RepID=A0A1I8B5A1_MELHA